MRRSVVYNSGPLNRTRPAQTVYSLRNRSISLRWSSVHASLDSAFRFAAAVLHRHRCRSLRPPLTGARLQAAGRAARRRAPAVGRRGGEAGARAEPRHSDRAAEPADPGHRDRAGAQLLGAATSRPASTTTRPNNPPTSALVGRPDEDHRFTVFRRRSASPRCCRPAPTTRSAWNSARPTSTNIFSNFDPLLSSNVRSTSRSRCCATSRSTTSASSSRSAGRIRESADVQLQSTIVATTRNVKNAYWDLAYQIDNLAAQQSVAASWPSGCSRTTRSACRSARWRRSTSSRRSRRSRATKSR